MVTPITKNVVNREDQIDAVKQRVTDIRHGESVSNTIFEWYGIPGIGKSSLCQSLLVKLCKKEMGIPYACVDFEPERNKNAGRYATDSVLLLKDIITKLDIKNKPDFLKVLKLYRQRKDEERKQEVLEAFINCVKELLNDGPAVFLFDTTEKADSETLKWFEEAVISPLCLTQKCIIVWTGRYPQRWKQFGVRRRTECKKLEPLPPDATKDQVKLDDDLIYQLTNGHPLCNEEIARVIRDYQDKGKEAEKVELLETLMNKVIKEYVMEGIPHDLRTACVIISIVRYFDAALLKRILSEFADEFRKTKSFIEMIGRFTATYLVEWDDFRKGYALESTLRHILSQHMQLNQPEKYLSINRKAANIYHEWIEHVPANRSIYIIERLYHQANIAKSDEKTLSKISVRLEKELKEYLQEYYQDGNLEFTIPAMTRLKEEFGNDREMEKVLGEKVFTRLNKIIEIHFQTLEQRELY